MQASARHQTRNHLSAYFALLAALSFALSACSGSKSTTKQGFPVSKEVAAYPFGMTLQAFEDANDQAAQNPLDMGDFRVVMIENMPASNTVIESVVYYFDNEGNRPLYEYIINYHNTAARDAWAEKNLGPKNHKEGKEWLFKATAGYEVNAWVFKNKLVFAAAIAGSEWDLNGDGKIDEN